MENIEKYNDEIIKEFQFRCQNNIQFIEKIWSKIVLSDLSKSMVDLAQLFSELSEVIICLEKVMKIKNSFLDINNIFQKLELLQNAMSISDYILIADLIKYEIKPIISGWMLIFEDKDAVYVN